MPFNLDLKKHRIVLSNSYERLFCHLLESLKASSPFDKQLILVPSFATQHHLEKRIAEQLGICLGIEFAFFPIGLRQIVEQALKAKIDEKPLDLSLKIQKKLTQLALDPKGENVDELDKLIRYLKNHFPSKEEALIELADELSSLYRKYAWQSDDLDQWKFKKNKSWQKWVFEQVAQENSYLLNPKSLFDVKPSEFQVPLTVHCFGLSLIPPMALKVLNHFLPGFNFHVYFLSPTPLYWGDVKSPKEKKSYFKKLSKQGVLQKNIENLKAYQANDHPLLSNWGVWGRKGFEALELLPFNDLIEDYQGNEALLKTPRYEDFFDPESFFLSSKDPTLLERLKMDMMTLQEPQEITTIKEDQSIQVFSAPSIHREVQNLKQQIFKLLLEDPSLSLDRFAIYIVDIEKYIPYLEVEFSDTAFPFALSIHDSPFTRGNTVLKGLYDLIELKSGRWSIETFVRLIYNPKFIFSQRLTLQERETLIQWMHKIGVLWGRDEKHLKEIFKKTYNKEPQDQVSQVSWTYFFEACLELMLTSQSEELIDPMLRSLSIQDLGLLNVLYEVYDQIKADLVILESNQKATFEEWGLFLKELIQSYFSFEDEDGLTLISQIQEVAKGPLREKHSFFSFVTFWFYLKKDLSTFHPEIYHQKVGSLSVYSLFSKPLFEADYTFVLGLDEEHYPRNPQESSLSQWEEFSLPMGTLKLVEEDRYQLIHLLLCTQKQLNLSYLKKDRQTGKDQGPSLLIEELLSYCHRYYSFEGQYGLVNLIKDLPILSFDESYFKKENVSLAPYHLAKSHYLEPKESAKSMLYEKWLESDFFSLDSDALEKQVDLKSFLSFYKNPIQLYLQKHFPIISREDLWQNEHKPFTLTSFEKALLRLSLEEDTSLFEKHPFTTEGIFKILSEKALQKDHQEISQYLKEEGLLVEKAYALELRSDIDTCMTYLDQALICPSLNFSFTERDCLNFEGVIESVSPKGLINLSKPSFRVLWSLFPAVLLSSLAFEKIGRPFEPVVHFPLARKKYVFDLSHLHENLKCFYRYYQFGKHKLSLLIPDWISYFMDFELNEISKKIEQDLNSEHFHHEVLKDLFFSRKVLDLNFLEPWQAFAQTLLKTPYQDVQKALRAK